MRVKVMSIHGCQLAPSSLRSHLAVMPLRSGPTVRVDRTAPPASAAAGRATEATSPRPDLLLADHHVDVVDQEEPASKPLVHIGSRDGGRNLAHDVAF
jgi:hypothetical protein